MKVIRLWRRRPVFIGTVSNAGELVAALRAAAAVACSRRGAEVGR